MPLDSSSLPSNPTRYILIRPKPLHSNRTLILNSSFFLPALPQPLLIAPSRSFALFVFPIMNREKLMKMAGAVRTGGKGSMRRKKKAVHKTPTTDDKRLQSTLKRIGVNTIPAIEEVNIFKDDIVIQFPNPKVQASIAANTWVVSGSPQTKKLQDLLPAIINQLGPDNLENLRKLAEQFQKQAPAASAATGEEDDDDVPELVPGETFEEAAEEKQAS
ncbi:basic transcription factor 3-like [Musa acuminata AAA Group]|uniref:Nascent polypeptide-associated complex subunit beta n=1 Tax=Musa acuminata subsp. malaccensis TaxID=214687 RepID=A0A804ISD8_MUSAM|nr:PREDICTED: basic transcription factor 3 [Musa acuminata subsp. malaccensis]CAG1842989.1 unnamed protein product [Musa acuminata subsp. malaccensis]